MELTNDFRVSVPPAQAWKVFTDVERIAPLLPGAQLQEVEGDEYRGIVKVKVGPIQAQYKGVATFLEQDESAGKVVLKANGRDTRGQGNANATITATMVGDGDGTRVSVVTDLTVTGKVAQFGRGVLADVSGKLIGQFVDALEADLEKGGDVPGPAGDPHPPVEDAGAAAAGEALVGPDPEAAVPAPAADETAGLEGVLADGPVGAGTTAPAAAGTSAPPASGTASGPRKIDSPEPEPVDLLDAAGGSVAKRVAPAAGIAAAVLLFVVLRRRVASRRSKVQRAAASVPSWDEVRGQLPDTDALRQLGRRAAKKATKQAGRTGASAAAQVANASAVAVPAARRAAKQSAKAARRQAARARSQGLDALGGASRSS